MKNDHWVWFRQTMDTVLDKDAIDDIVAKNDYPLAIECLAKELDIARATASYYKDQLLKHEILKSNF